MRFYGDIARRSGLLLSLSLGLVFAHAGPPSEENPNSAFAEAEEEFLKAAKPYPDEAPPQPRDYNSGFAQPEDQFLKRVKPFPEPPPPPTAVLPEQIEVGPGIGSLDGASGLIVRNRQGQPRRLRVGDVLEPGDSFKTGDQGGLRLIFENGVQALFGTQTVARVANDESSKVPIIRLDKGELRALVAAKKEGDSSSDSALVVPFKLFIKTPSAYAGVRGTDFVFTLAENKVSLHTITGAVEFALNMSLLKQGRGVVVGPSRVSDVLNGKAPTRPESFNLAEFLTELYERQPHLESLWAAASREAKSEQFNSKFNKIRAQKAAAINFKRGVATPNRTK